MLNYAQTRGFYGSLVLGSVTARLRKARRYIKWPLPTARAAPPPAARPGAPQRRAGGRLRPRVQAEPIVRGAQQGSRLRHHRREHDAGLEGRVLIRTVAASIILQSVPQPIRERRRRQAENVQPRAVASLQISELPQLRSKGRRAQSCSGVVANWRAREDKEENFSRWTVLLQNPLKRAG
jgi:hypothetical protein